MFPIRVSPALFHFFLLFLFVSFLKKRVRWFERCFWRPSKGAGPGTATYTIHIVGDVTSMLLCSLQKSTPKLMRKVLFDQGGILSPPLASPITHTHKYTPPRPHTQRKVTTPDSYTLHPTALHVEVEPENFACARSSPMKTLSGLDSHGTLSLHTKFTSLTPSPRRNNCGTRGRHTTTTPLPRHDHIQTHPGLLYPPLRTTHRRTISISPPPHARPRNTPDRPQKSTPHTLP